MAKKEKKIDVRVCFDGEQEAADVFVELLVQKIKHTKMQENIAKTQGMSYNDHEFSNLKSA